MKITYIYHSSFSLEFDDMVLIFDYFKGELPVFPKNKMIYVFASHKHQDHYDKKIFNLALQYPNIRFLLSSDIKMNEKYMQRIQIPAIAQDKIKFLNKNESYTVADDITVETLRSTDQGIAFIVTTHGKSIYHAGDLNWWTWKGETKKEYEEMTKAFQDEIAKIKDRHFDVAFLPLDPRQEERFYLGFDYFMRNTTTDQAIPMHYWEKPEVIDWLKGLECSEKYCDRIVELRKAGQSVCC